MRHQARPVFVLLTLFLSLWADQAYALCLSLTFSGVNATPTFSGGTGEYNAFDAITRAQTVSFNVNGLVNLGTCSFFVTLRAGQSGNANARRMSLGGKTLAYQAYTDASMSNVLLPAAGATASNVDVGNFGPLLGLTQTQNMSFTWTIPPGQVAGATTTRYTDPGVALELYEGVPGVAGYTLRDTINLTFQSRVESSVDVAVIGSGGTFNAASTNGNVSFGTASSNAVRSFDLSVRSNDGYAVTLQSTNGQKLRHTGSASATIPYSLTVNGGAVNLPAGSVVGVASQAGAVTAATGTNLPVQVKLGTLTGTETAGSYQDFISVGITAK